MKIVKVTPEHLDTIAVLFDKYRVFYKQTSDVAAAKLFLENRIKKEQSVIFIALDNKNKGIGFTQLYPTFSSVSLQSFFILNDLFVLPEARNTSIGALLLSKAKNLCKEEKCKGLALETALDNPAKKLYERLGWKQDTDFLHYFWTNNLK